MRFFICIYRQKSLYTLEFFLWLLSGVTYPSTKHGLSDLILRAWGKLCYFMEYEERLFFFFYPERDLVCLISPEKH